MAFCVTYDETLKDKWNKAALNFDAQIFAAEFASALPGDGTIQIKMGKQGSYNFDLRAQNPKTGEDEYQIRFSLDFQKQETSLDGFFIYEDQKKGLGLAKTGLKQLFEKSKELGFKGISLSAEDERGVSVWASYGWLPRENDWHKVQREAARRLDAIPHEKLQNIDPDTIGTVRMMLSPNFSPDTIFSLLACEVRVDGEKLSHKLLSWQKTRSHLDFGNRWQMHRFHRRVYGFDKPMQEGKLDIGTVYHPALHTFAASRPSHFGSPS